MQIPTDWTFKNRSVADNFDRHVREQLPWYDLATGAVAHTVRHYLPCDGRMYDIGCSTGNISRLIADSAEARNATVIGIDNSSEMIDNWDGYGTVETADATTYTYQPFDVAVLFLVLMFIPVATRQKYVSDLCDQCRPGGAIIIVDKVGDYDGYLGTVMHRLTMAGKVATGTTSEAIVQKELSLSGIQRPIDPRTELPTGFREFFRFGEFVGLIYENNHKTRR